jgi:DNA-binding winged helix-turn-helix (wHTH) protein
MAKPNGCLDDPAKVAHLVDGSRRLVGILRVLANLIEEYAPPPAASTRDEPHASPHLLSFPPFHLDLVNEALWRGDTRVPLRAKQFRILRYLVERPQRLVTQEELILAIWGRVVTSDSLLRTHIHKLRKAIGKGFIETHNGRGYRFLRPVARASAAAALSQRSEKRHKRR